MADLSLEREFNVTPARLFEVISTHAMLLQWWGHDGWTMRDAQLEFSALGLWHSAMISANCLTTMWPHAMLTGGADRWPVWRGFWKTINTFKAEERKMPEFMFAFHGGGMPETPEEGAKAMAAWNAWYTEMGDAVVNPGNPVGMSKTVSAKGVEDNGGANPLSGFVIVKAADIDAACKLAAGCPMVVDGSGTAEVAPIVEM